jgi:hypothetical protein
MPNARRFPPPWTIEELNDACFIVRDKNGYVPGLFATTPAEWAAEQLVFSHQVIDFCSHTCAVHCSRGWPRWCALDPFADHSSGTIALNSGYPHP